MPFTIKDIENLTGIKSHTIRIWEKRYSFLKPGRTDTNIRYYSGEELKILLNIALLNKYGFKISHIDKMTPKGIGEKIISLTSAGARQTRIINDLIEKMVNVDIHHFENILDECISSYGIEKTILTIIFPFLEKIGILWLTDNINPAQEHLVSNVIRQKILVGIELTRTKLRTGPQVCLFLPEGEYHELTLLFVAFLLKKHGITVVYVGASIPMPDVQYIMQLKKPDYLYTHLTTAGRNFDVNNFITDLAKNFKEIPIIISGKLTANYRKKIPANVSLKRSLEEIVTFVESL